MPSNFPTTLDTLTNPAAGDQLSNATTPHATQHTNVNDILEALEAKLGLGASTPGASAAVLRRTSSGASAWGQVQTADLATTLANRSATLVVAASNASAASIAAADYACDGTADQVEILAAMNALPASGGRVVLTEGTFAISAGTTYPKANVHLQGMGRGATILRVVNAGGAPINDNLFVLGQVDCSIVDLTIDGNKANNAGATSMVMIRITERHGLARSVHALNSVAQGITTQTTAAYARLLDCIAEGCVGIGITARSVGSGYTLVHGCYAIGCGTGFLSDGLAFAVFEQCVAASSTGVGFNLSFAGTQARNCASIGNTGYGFQVAASNIQMSGCYSTSNANVGIGITSGTGCQIVGCDSVGDLIGLYLVGGSRHVVQSNIVSLSQQYGIYIGAAETLVVGNKVFDCGTATNNTYSQILLSAADCFASGNMVRRGAGANRAVYGLQVGAVANAYVGANDLYDSGVTANITDGGTNTRRITKVQLNYVAGVVLNGAALPANTWTTIVTGQTFRADSETSRFLITVRCSMLVGVTSAVGSAAMRVVIDAVTPYQIAADRITVGADYAVVTGGTVSVYGLTGGTNHTITLQIFTTQLATGYCRAIDTEFCYIDVEEFQR